MAKQATSTATAQPVGRKKISVALQGGGAHGAFTWGVLDRLLEDERIEIEGLSGTSAGAMNAAAFTQGYLVGGASGARAALDVFWERMSRYAVIGPVKRSPIDKLVGNWNLDASPTYHVFDTMMRLFSPYQLNPFNFHPIRDVLSGFIDIDAIRASTELKLFVTATNVRTGKIRVFDNSDVTIDALLASGCLPLVFQSVMIDGDPYWDGGYMGNPAIFPLIYGCTSPDVLVIEINPLTRPGAPTQANEILNRVNEISFNSSLMNEMRAIAFVSRLIETRTHDDGPIGRLRKMHIHMISGGDAMIELGVSSKFNAELDFLRHLKDLGRQHAADWLERSFGDVGHRSSINVREVFL